MTRVELPHPGPPTDAQLCSAIDSELTVSMPGTRVRSVRRQPAAYRASFHLEELDVELDDGRMIPMMFKDVGGLVGPSRQVKPPFLHDPLREITVYKFLLQPARFNTPVCYGALASIADHRYWLFLERVAGLQLRECGEFDRWQQAAAWLARLHSEFAPQAASLRGRERLLRLDRNYFAMWMPRAVRTVTDPAAKRFLQRLASRYETVVERLASLPVTLIHGEFYPSNILVRDVSGDVAPVDWEMAAIGPGIIDLAALVTGWPEAEALALTRTYFDAARAPLSLTSFEHLTSVMDCARLHFAVQWLGWSADWEVPAEHRHDWSQAALALAERVMPRHQRANRQE